jgi:hypothetical protein
MRRMLLAAMALSGAALAVEPATVLVSKVVTETGYVALILGEGGPSPLLQASYRCVPHTDRFYAREYDDDREGMAGEAPDSHWTKRGFKQADCDSTCTADAAPFGNHNDWTWRKPLDKAAAQSAVDGLLKGYQATHATRASLAARRAAVGEFRRLCGL